MPIDSKGPKRWKLREVDDAAAARISKELSLNPITARILLGRGVSGSEEAWRFLEPRLDHIPDPFGIPGMDAAVARIAQAISLHQSIAVFGDYDVDGVTAAALLKDFLGELGAEPIVLLPERLERGYGIDAETVDRLASEGANLIITVDNGIRAEAAAERAAELGIDLVITDHHVPEGDLPRASAIVNPKLMENGSPLKDLSGCGVAFMLAMALRKRLRDEGSLGDPEPNLRAQLDFVALGTIADIMPLTGVNRVLASFGLEEISRARRLGLRALLEVSGAWPASVSPGMVTYRLAPRINAAGRMGSATRALDLLLSSDEDEAMVMARQLDRANGERQRMEERALREAIRRIEALDEIPDGIVVSSEGWHVGVIGIVAAKLVETYGRPAIVISLDPSPPRGSGRSPEGTDLLGALAPCANHLIQYGGHAQAAGLAVEEASIDAFAEAFAASCARAGSARGARSLVLDAVVRPDEVTQGLVEEISRCSPFGIGNPEPVLAFEGASAVEARVVGTNLLKLTISAGGSSFDAIGFNMAERMGDGLAETCFAFTPQFNTWNGRTSIQLKIIDIAPQPFTA